jgi:carbon storage regulator
MLILSRKQNESIIIGDNIKITVSSIRGRYVRIGIEAPEEIRIIREELSLAPAKVPSLADLDTRRHIKAAL